MFYLFSNVRKIFLQLIIFSFVAGTAFGDNQTTSAENVTCEKVESSEFPQDLFTEGQRKCGALILHLIFFCYVFWAIALVCSERFLPAITCICEDLKLSDDVAAATFMSIATSSPELFSNIIGTFITESSIGVGHVIGNGYYNMFFVAAVGGLAASQEIVLEWWPLARDCCIYTVVALVLTIIVLDGVVTTLESLFLLLLYFAYFMIMFANKKIINFLSEKFKWNIIPQEEGVEDPPESLEPVERMKRQEKGDIEEEESLEPENYQLPPPLNYPTSEVRNERWEKATKVLAMPIVYSMRYTIPDVRIKSRRKYYPVSFVICVVWIGISTYFGTWMISVIGETVGIPDLVMGMTFMAAGGSVVEAYSVYYKARRGECKIGLSNCLGCNTLDATLCLGLPWFVRTLIPDRSDCGTDTSSVVLDSSLVYVNSILLVVSTIALYFVFYLNKFKLDKRLGLICGVLYALVIFIAISVENYAQSVSH